MLYPIYCSSRAGFLFVNLLACLFAGEAFVTMVERVGVLCDEFVCSVLCGAISLSEEF